MKRLFAILAAAALVVSLCACGSSVPDGLSKETYKLGTEALEIADKYMAGKIDKETAEDKFSDIYEKLEVEAERLEVHFNEALETGNDDDNNVMKSFNASNVMFYVSYFVLAMDNYNNGYTSFDCQIGRDGLAEALNPES